MEETAEKAIYKNGRFGASWKNLRWLNVLLDIFRPNKIFSKKAFAILVIFQVMAGLWIWSVWPSKIMPKPGEVFSAFVDLIANQGLLQDLWISFSLNLQMIFWTTILALFVSYSTALPFFRPIVALVSKFRFLSFAGLNVMFSLTFSGHNLKLSLLVFSMGVFFVTSMVNVLSNVPEEELEYARTLRMNEWRVVWEIKILGKLDAAMDVLSQNAAMGLMMLTAVEGLVRGEGGIGVMLLNQNKHFALDGVIAIQITYLLAGLAQDGSIGWLKNFLFPYAALALGRRQ